MYLQKWLEYCSLNDYDPFSPSTTNALDFLTFLYSQGLSFNTINIARSALSCFCNCEGLAGPFGQLSVVKRFMKGVLQLLPSLPRHHLIWDAKQIFDFCRSQPPVDELSQKNLMCRITLLLCLLSGQHCQTIHCLNVEQVDVTETEYTVDIVEKLKHTCPGVHQKPLRFIKYDIEPRLCITDI